MHFGSLCFVLFAQEEGRLSGKTGLKRGRVGNSSHAAAATSSLGHHRSESMPALPVRGPSGSHEGNSTEKGVTKGRGSNKGTVPSWLADDDETGVSRNAGLIEEESQTRYAGGFPDLFRQVADDADAAGATESEDDDDDISSLSDVDTHAEEKRRDDALRARQERAIRLSMNLQARARADPFAGLRSKQKAGGGGANAAAQARVELARHASSSGVAFRFSNPSVKTKYTTVAIK